MFLPKTGSFTCRVLRNARSIMSIGISNTRLKEPTAPIPGKVPKWSDKESEIFADLKDGATIYINGACGVPSILSKRLMSFVQEANIKNIKIWESLPLDQAEWIDKNEFKNIRLETAFASASCQKAIREGRADYVPICSSDIPLLFRKKHINIDYALIMVSPPDIHGYCSLGASVGSARSAIQNADKIIAQVNQLSPITYGDSAIHLSKIDYLFNGNQNLIEMPVPSSTPIKSRIAKLIVENFIVDGATIQFGFGRIPFEVATNLRQHRQIGIHSEIIGDEIVDLVNLGVITNSAKNVHRGKIIASYVIGTRKVFDFINENPFVALYDIAWVNSPEVIARNPKVTAINTAYQMDLTGQSVGDSMGTSILSGIGGKLDYLRAASQCPDGEGKPIIALTSKNPQGESSIVPFLTDGGGVVATRAHIHYVVTEYGIAYLFGKSLRQRAYHLIKISHPDFRESLEKAAFERLKVMPSA